MVRILGRKGFRESEFRVKKFGDSSELAGFQQSKFLKGGKCKRSSKKLSHAFAKVSGF